MYKLTFTLKQHTPIIHFQHEQYGASLRATEVKPKLDRFIIEKMGGKQKVPKEWFLGEHDALDYKIKIEPNKNDPIKILDFHTNSPMYFGNMGGENPPKYFKFIEISEGIIISRNYDLCEHISIVFSDFFFLNNFGSRQSKGYGSFTVLKYKLSNNDSVRPILNDNLRNFSINFDIDKKIKSENIYLEPFKQLDWFYRSLRSGINYKGLYFKSALFMYLYNVRKIQWDKKTIKAHYLVNPDQALLEFNKNKQKNMPVNILYMTKQSETHNNPDILYKPTKQTNELELKLWRDLLGLSTEESWYSYRAKVSKKEGEKNILGNWSAVNKQNVRIERFKSPITFKPVITGNSFVVHILINQQIVNELLLNKFKMLIEIKHNGLKYKDNGKDKYDDTLKAFDKSSLVLPFPDNFDFIGFLKFAFNIDVEKHIETPIKPDYELQEIKNSLKYIYAELKKQSNINQL